MMSGKTLIAFVSFLIASFANASECSLKHNMQDHVDVIGSFSNMRYTDKHAYGYTVELWRSSDCLVGLFLSSNGLSGEMPAGLIENMKYDEKSGAVSFDTRLSTGLVLLENVDPRSYVSSKDLYKFSGILKNKKLSGIVLHENKALPDGQPPTTENVVLDLVNKNNSEMRNFSTFSQWQLEVKTILKNRGPKW